MSAFCVNITGCLFNHQGNILACTGLKTIIVLVAMVENYFSALEFKTKVADLAVWQSFSKLCHFYNMVFMIQS